jgi:hypothetical protein
MWKQRATAVQATPDSLTDKEEASPIDAANIEKSVVKNQEASALIDNNCSSVDEAIVDNNDK